MSWEFADAVSSPCPSIGSHSMPRVQEDYASMNMIPVYLLPVHPYTSHFSLQNPPAKHARANISLASLGSSKSSLFFHLDAEKASNWSLRYDQSRWGALAENDHIEMSPQHSTLPSADGCGFPCILHSCW